MYVSLFSETMFIGGVLSLLSIEVSSLMLKDQKARAVGLGFGSDPKNAQNAGRSRYSQNEYNGKD